MPFAEQVCVPKRLAFYRAVAQYAGELPNIIVRENIKESSFQTSTFNTCGRLQLDKNHEVFGQIIKFERIFCKRVLDLFRFLSLSQQSFCVGHFSSSESIRI